MNDAELAGAEIPKFDSSEDTEDNTAIYASIGIVSAGACASLAAFAFNKMPNEKVDNAAFFVPFLISLNMYDFISDINLSIQIFILICIIVVVWRLKC